MVKDRILIEIMARSYRQNKIFIIECEMYCRPYCEEELSMSRKIVEHIETVVRYMNDKDRFIIHHEVILGKTGKWYRDHLSQPSYYRHRKEAYRTFLRNLEA